MTEGDHRKPLEKKGSKRALFLASVLVVYVVLYAASPTRAGVALRASAGVFAKILVPLALVFLLLSAVNLLVKPFQIAKFMGKESGIRGIILSTGAGILSIGPIYAWYPILRELLDRGAKDSLIAVFLNNRAVKPFLIPVMISYFGWLYVGLLTLFTILGSIACGWLVGTLGSARDRR